ncbi:hypothetical protein [Bradyrhizobium sp. dw_78]|uniref:hypothetical protein n=1 Tax=Bradyrhizobium sp. dw_78 TaxID=2719793 RepID=UPI001BD32512|nr:hypothetical protein [Bradyrhizobium sp. dw_78]
MASDGEKWITFLRQYGPLPRNESMFDEHISRSARRLKIRQISFKHPLEDALFSAFRADGGEPRSVVLTGTAGDGKSHLCGRVWEMLNGSSKEWSTNEIYFQLNEVVIGGRAVTVHVIRDFTALPDTDDAGRYSDKYELLRKMAASMFAEAPAEVFLLTANDGQLIEAWRHVDDEPNAVRMHAMLEARLRDLYHSILGASTTSDTYSASEATEDFMARLRISVIADQAPPPDPNDGCPYDIVFSQDVISRHAKLEWHKEDAKPADIKTLLPSRWSRRRPAAADDLKSSVYLCCPVQSAEGWSYLSAVASLFRGDWDGDENRRLLPVRQLDFRDGRTARIFEETHNLGNWVVNFDELLDRRQLLNQEVRIIRYKQSATQGRNVIISSRAPLSLLRSMILHRLRALNTELSGADLALLAERLISDANDVSGDIVLRAAKRGHSASELIGVVLSRALVKDEIGEGRPVGWYFLDDYAAWMGQREEQLADLLTLSPEESPDGTLRLTIIVTEAKYIDDASLPVKRKESQKQLRDTMHRISEAIFGNPDRLDRESWLARIADLVLDGIRLPAASGIDLATWRRAIREGRCEINLRGYSHVFVPTAVEGADRTEAYAVPSVSDAYQEIYGRGALKQLLLAYWHKQSPGEIRISAGADYLDADPAWRAPGSGDPIAAPAAPKRPAKKQGPSGNAPEPGPAPRPNLGSGPASPPKFPRYCEDISKGISKGSGHRRLKDGPIRRSVRY